MDCSKVLSEDEKFLCRHFHPHWTAIIGKFLSNRHALQMRKKGDKNGIFTR